MHEDCHSTVSDCHTTVSDCHSTVSDGPIVVQSQVDGVQRQVHADPSLRRGGSEAGMRVRPTACAASAKVGCGAGRKAVSGVAVAWLKSAVDEEGWYMLMLKGPCLLTLN